MSIVQIPNVRAAFLQVFAPKAFADNDKATFQASFLLPPGHPGIKAIEAAMLEVALEKWPKDGAQVLAGLRAKDRTCLRDGNDKKQYDGFEGNLYVSASSEKRPGVVDADGTPLVAADGRPYSGAYVYGTVDVWAQDNQFGRRVNATLLGVQFYRDGDHFSGGATLPSDWATDLSEGADSALA